MPRDALRIATPFRLAARADDPETKFAPPWIYVIAHGIARDDRVAAGPFFDGHQRRSAPPPPRLVAAVRERGVAAMAEYQGCEIPEDLWYDLNYCWARPFSDGIFRIGLASPSQAMAGRLQYVIFRLPTTHRAWIDRYGVVCMRGVE